jgi:GNAT superfamily N-acetyltransferase
MFNEAMIYVGRYQDSLKKEFVEKFPGVCDELSITFANDTKGGDRSWADCVYFKGAAYNIVFSAYIGKLYGNCGISTVSGLDVGNQYRRKGIGRWVMDKIETMLAELGNTIAIGTTKQDQVTMENILMERGWDNIESCKFVNRRTNNEIKFWRKHLKEVDKKTVPSIWHRNTIV